MSSRNETPRNETPPPPPPDDSDEFEVEVEMIPKKANDEFEREVLKSLRALTENDDEDEDDDDDDDEFSYVNPEWERLADLSGDEVFGSSGLLARSLIGLEDKKEGLVRDPNTVVLLKDIPLY